MCKRMRIFFRKKVQFFAYCHFLVVSLASPIALSLGNQNKNFFFLLYFARLFVPLHPQMDKQIRHDGIIASIDGERHIKVRILQTSACNDCKVASHCHTVGSKEKIVDVITDNDTTHWQVGQQVVVSTESRMAGRALIIGFGLPLLLMLMVMVVALAAKCSEGLTALLMLVSLVPYYIIVWLCRDRIAKEVVFKLEEKTN